MGTRIEVVVTDAMIEFLDAQVADGRFLDRSEVVQEALLGLMAARPADDGGSGTGPIASWSGTGGAGTSTIDVEITDAMARYVSNVVARGWFSDPSSVIRSALRSFMDKEPAGEPKSNGPIATGPIATE